MDVLSFKIITGLYVALSLGFLVYWMVAVVSARRDRRNAFRLVCSFELDKDITKADPMALKEHLDWLRTQPDGSLDDFTVAISAAYFLRENHTIPSFVFDQEVNSLAPMSIDRIKALQERALSPENLKRLMARHQCQDRELTDLASQLSKNFQKLLLRKRYASVA